MSRLSKESAFSSVASTSQIDPEEEASTSASNRTLNVTLLSGEWKSTKGGLSTISRELAIQLAKHPNVEVSVYLPKCSEEDKKIAASLHVKLVEAEELPGLEPLLWLSSVPEHHVMDCVIGHGVQLGRQIPLIKRQNRHCKWIQIVHTAPEDLGMYKSYEEAISKGEQKHQGEVKLCEMADQVVAVGPKLADAFACYLRPSKKDQDVLTLTPSIFNEFLGVEQATEERRRFCVLVFGRGDSEDFKLKGYDIAVQAVAELKDTSYQLMFVGAPVGKEDEVKDRLLQHGIPPSKLTVRCFKESRDELAKLFCEADLAIMPSRTEGFGLTALEALSAGLPVLVGGNSGLGVALKEVVSGSQCVVDSEDLKEWAKKIKAVREKSREVRLAESKLLRDKYLEKFRWQESCGLLLEKMQNLVFGSSETKGKKDKRPLPLFDNQPSKPPRGELTDHEGSSKRETSAKVRRSSSSAQVTKQPRLLTGIHKGPARMPAQPSKHGKRSSPGGTRVPNQKRLLTRTDKVDERVIRNETMKFEAEHEECVRVLPYQLKNGDIEIHLYVYGDKSGIPTKLEEAAQTFFGQYGWKLKWDDLYNDAFNVLQVTSIECSSGKPKRLEAYQVDEIEETINNHLHIFSNHRNVTAVQPFFKVTKSIQTEEACIMVYVLGKGQIPMGEKAIPPAIGPYRVDVVNGFCVRTKDPYMPIEAHKQKDFLRLGASIGVYGKQSSGTLGAIVEDERRGTLYALSCDHVMHDADESKIIHPGFDVYLNCLRFNLNGYKDWISRIPDQKLDLQLPAISDDSTDEAELQNIFEQLREMPVDLERCSNSAREQITIFERNLEEAFGRRPRVIASYSAGVRRNVCSEMSGREHFIDAAISELDENEVKNVKAEKFLQICDTTHYPSGNCILATTNETMNVEEVFKSGSATGFTESRLILGSSQSLPTFIRDFRRNGECAWIDVDCINCKKRRTAQTQVQEWTDPCEQCQEHSGWLKSCLCIQQHGSKPFSDKGDSGAVIFEKRRKENRNEYQLPSDGFGIIFAELPTQIGIFAIASPLETALKALSQKVSESRPDSEPCQLRLVSGFR